MNDRSIRWNSERMDSLLSGVNKMRPIASTGFQLLDDIIKGWSQGVTLISAPPAAGKSTWVLQSVDHVARFSDRKVLFISCEMPSSSLIIKSVCRLSGELDAQALTFGEVLELSRRLNDDDARAKLLLSAIDVYATEVAPNIATLDDCLSIDDIFKIYESLPSGDLAPLCVVDYLQILRSQNGDSLSDYQEISRIMSSLCELSKTYQIPVLAIASQNRNKRNTSDFSSLNGSSTLEYGANSIIFLDTDESEQTRSFYRTVTLKVAKSKFTPIGSFEMEFHPASSRFEELTTT